MKQLFGKRTNDDGILIAIELHSVERIGAALDGGLNSRARVPGKPLVNWLTEMYSRGDNFSKCLRLLLDRGPGAGRSGLYKRLRPMAAGASEPPRLKRHVSRTCHVCRREAMKVIVACRPGRHRRGKIMQKKVVPMFHVTDVRRTVDWYRDIGFEVKETYGDGGDGLSFAIMAFGAGEVMFNSGGQLGSKHRREVDLYAYTEEIDALHDRIKDRIEIIEGPHNMFYGMREVIVRDLNGFWITFGQEIPAEVLTPWPAVDSELLGPYKGKYKSDGGSAVLITIHEGRLLAFPEDAPGVFLRPAAEHTFTPVMSQQASVSFEGSTELMTSLTFEQDGKAMRFVRVR